MSATKSYVDANCFYNKATGKFDFTDNYSDSPPSHIMRQRLHNAGLLKDHLFKYNCSDLERHKFYQKLHRGVTVRIDEQWYNTYLEMQQPSNWLCTVQCRENSKLVKRKVDFVTTINENNIAFWFDEESKQFYCRIVTSPTTI